MSVLASFPVEIDAALHANSLAIRFADQVDGQIQQKVIPNWLPKVNVTIFRDYFFVELVLGPVFKDIKLLEFGR